jgi:hypothetical protein
MSRIHKIADRKALLAARAEIDRARMTLAIFEMKAIVAPPPDASRVARLRPVAAMLAGFAVPLIGGRRLRRWLRVLSYGLTALRVARGFRADR